MDQASMARPLQTNAQIMTFYYYYYFLTCSVVCLFFSLIVFIVCNSANKHVHNSVVDLTARLSWIKWENLGVIGTPGVTHTFTPGQR